MVGALSEYEVEDCLIKRLVELDYDFVKMTNHDDLKANLHVMSFSAFVRTCMIEEPSKKGA